MMNQWQLNGFGIDSLHLEKSAVPKPGPGELLIRVSAASLNYRDKLVVEGRFFPDLPFPFVPLSDAAGVVAAAGEGVTRFKQGDRVTTHFFTGWLDGPVPSARDALSLGGPLPGVLSEYVIAHENGVVATPGYLSDLESATLPIAALTAWWALFENRPLKPGEIVLVQGTGGVSLFALQLAVAFGSRVIVTSGSDEKLERAKKLGASGTVNYSGNQDWDRHVLAITDGRGVDHVLEVVGGDNVERSLNALARGGQIILIGFLQNEMMKLNILAFMLKSASMQGVTVGHRVAFESMNRALETKGIHPIIDAIYPFEAARAALGHLNRGPFGKVIIDFAAC